MEYHEEKIYILISFMNHHKEIYTLLGLSACRNWRGGGSRPGAALGIDIVAGW
jgi:hypothetical protein